ncbi:uncharacterized protein LOC129728708 [Wyeomyia smithii]|uniref:uncharacterized protein LOC129728708 n=1 Tax=Wyeomyia smithii TaxID=174621 RepID=UPI002467C659|nr:uncharacterized protein LOC129728708 [Wyeomyia smithii]XP_055543145.1 uncharacterized protein LOC129728708 [Wyeomyia smithii]
MSSIGYIASEGKQIFEQIFNMFDDLNSEHKCFGMLKRYDLLMEPREFLISNELRAGVSQNKQEISNDPVTGLLMPIKFHMKKYLEADNVLETILKYLEPSSDGYIRSFVDGTIWQERVNNLKSNVGAKIVLPLNLFFDDFKTGDTASPHATRTSICGIYYYIPSLPGYLLAKLANMHVAGFILTEDRKRYANDDLFFSLIDMLIELETDGIEINYRNSTMKINFMLAFITGDNLGLSEVLDLVESVRANFYCRMCKRNRQERETDCIEYENSFRTIESCAEDIKVNDTSVTGIKRESIFNRIPSYHIINNVYFDLMHDVWEGICVYALGHCLNYFIKIKKYLLSRNLTLEKTRSFLET